jgi:hypothetical protein
LGDGLALRSEIRIHISTIALLSLSQTANSLNHLLLTVAIVSIERNIPKDHILDLSAFGSIIHTNTRERESEENIWKAILTAKLRHSTRPTIREIARFLKSAGRGTNAIITRRRRGWRRRIHSTG